MDSEQGRLEKCARYVDPAARGGIFMLTQPETRNTEHEARSFPHGYDSTSPRRAPDPAHEAHGPVARLPRVARGVAARRRGNHGRPNHPPAPLRMPLDENPQLAAHP